MSGPAINQKLEVLQGVDLRETFLFFNPPTSGSKDPAALVPVDFTGATARMMVKSTSDSSGTVLLSLTTSSGLAWTAGTITPGPTLPSYNNGIIITVTRTQSLALSAATAYYDLLVDWSNGTTSMLARGAFAITATATR